MRTISRALYTTILLAGCEIKVVGTLPEDTTLAGPDETTPGGSDVTGPSSDGGPPPIDSGEGPGPLDLGGIVDDREVVQLSAHSVASCALLSDGAVRCWGANEQGELGHGNLITIGDDESPADAGDVPLGEPAIRVAVGGAHVCALLASGGVKCWGYGDEGGLGYGNKANVGDDESPASVGYVDIGEPALDIVAGWRHTCALLAGGRIRCWGENVVGELGYGHTDMIGDDETPASAGDVPVGGEVVGLALGLSTTCAWLADGGLRCWGSNEVGQLGLPGIVRAGDDELPSSLPLVDVGGPVVDVAAAAYKTCALLASGEVRCFGQSWDFPLGVGAPPISCVDGDLPSCDTHPLCCVGDDETPASLSAIDVGDDIVDLSGVGLGVCALRSSGEVACWGSNRVGLMGRGTTPPAMDCYSCADDPQCCVGDDETPASLGPVALGGAALEISVGQAHACARLVGGDVRCWGYNEHGELGLGHSDVIGDDELPSAAPPLQIVD